MQMDEPPAEFTLAEIQAMRCANLASLSMANFLHVLTELPGFHEDVGLQILALGTHSLLGDLVESVAEMLGVDVDAKHLDDAMAELHTVMRNAKNN
jgi:hypothetical protein